MKEHKKQILAVLALALALGMVMPSAVFASEGAAEGGEAGIEALAEGSEGANGGEDGAGEKEETLGLTDSIAELYKRIQNDEGFATYRKFPALIENTQAINKSGLLGDAITWARETDCFSSGNMAGKVYTWLSADTKTALSGKKVYQVLAALQADEEYAKNTGYKNIIDGLVKSNNDLSTAEVAQIKIALPSLENVETMDLGAMVSTVERSANYKKYASLYNSLDFLKLAISGTAVSADALKSLYTEEDLMKNYNAMAVAAAAIDSSATKGLYAYTLPTTSAPEEKPKVDAPDTGIVGMIESGALDLGTLTLIVSVALASVAGLGLIAKLYLKHKF